MAMKVNSQLDETPDQAPTNGALTAYTFEQYLEYKELVWAVEDLFPKKALAILYGASGSGKTFAALDLVMAIAEGLPWFGHATIPGRVWYFVLEGEFGFQSRLVARLAYYGTGSDNIRFVTGPFALNNPKEVKTLIDFILRNGGADVVVVDTLNQGALMNENAAKDMGMVIRGAKQLCDQLRALVFLVHHAGKNEARGPRGHSSLYAAADAVMLVTRRGDTGEIKLVKSKDGPDGITHAFRLHPVEIGKSASGKPITSCVLLPSDGTALPPGNPEPKGPNQRALLDGFLEILVQQKLDAYANGEDDIPGIPMEDALVRFDDVFEHVDVRHRKWRLQATINALVGNGFLSRRGDQITLRNH